MGRDDPPGLVAGEQMRRRAAFSLWGLSLSLLRADDNAKTPTGWLGAVFRSGLANHRAIAQALKWEGSPLTGVK